MSDKTIPDLLDELDAFINYHCQGDLAEGRALIEELRVRYKELETTIRDFVAECRP